MIDECHWCGRLDELSEHPSTDDIVELLCYTCFEDSYTCVVCTNLSSHEIFGKLSDPAQPDDICNDCYIKMQDSVRVLEGTNCVCGRPINPESACMDFGLPHCEECGNMYKEYFSQ